ncbi:MAG TPA: hypothetical protein VH591_12640 [Ktedonobacterales bacterium]|jgi:hypothetical protein
MDNVLRTIEANWAVLLALVVSLSVAGALLRASGAIVWFFREVIKNVGNVNFSFAESHARRKQELFADGLYPELVEKIEAALGPNVVDEIANALANKRLEVFWPNLRCNLLTNFVINLVFFTLGVVVTLMITQHH